jgi:hypothetical protein
MNTLLELSVANYHFNLSQSLNDIIINSEAGKKEKLRDS